MHNSTRFAIATIVACVLAGSALTAQTGLRSISAQAGSTAVGTLRVDTISETPTPIFGLGFSIVNTGTEAGGGGTGAGKATFSEFAVSRQSDGASPLIFKAAATGQHLAKVTIDVFRPNTSIIDATYILSEVTVSSYNTDGNFEKVAFTYRRIEFISGGVRTCYDLGTVAGC